METAEEMCETSGSRTKDIGLRDFLFQKSYCEEMVTCLQAFTPETQDLFTYWHEAKHYFSLQNVFEAMNTRCLKYGVEAFQEHEWPIFLSKIEHEWHKQIVMMIVMLTV